MDNIQKPEGNIAWQVVTVLVTNMLIGGSFYLLLSTIIAYAYSSGGVGTIAQVVDLIFSILGVMVGVSLASAYLLTKYTITSDNARKITLWTTGILFIFNLPAFLGGGNIAQIISPLIYVGAVYVFLSVSFDQNRDYLERFTNKQVRVTELIILLAGILAVILGGLKELQSVGLYDSVKLGEVIVEDIRDNYPEVTIDERASNLSIELHSYYHRYGKNYPLSLIEEEFHNSRFVVYAKSTEMIKTDDFEYFVAEDLQSFEFCLIDEPDKCWAGEYGYIKN